MTTGMEQQTNKIIITKTNKVFQKMNLKQKFHHFIMHKTIQGSR